MLHGWRREPPLRRGYIHNDSCATAHRQSRSTLVLVVTGDPGGARVLIPGIRELKRRQPRWRFKVLAGPNSAPLWSASGFRAQPWPALRLGRVTCRNILLDAAPNILVTGTSFENSTESWFRQAALETSIPSFSALDHWCNYRHRYEIGRKLILPDVIGVMDGLATEKMVRAGIPRRKLAVIGHPVLEPFMKKRRRASLAKKQVLFLSEPISWDGKLNPKVVRYRRHNELTILKNLLMVFARCSELRRHPLRIRPHPLEPLLRLKKILREHAPRDLRVTIDRGRSLEKDFACSRVVLGITSIALLQALLMGASVLSLQTEHTHGTIPDDILCFLPRIRSKGCFIEAVSKFVRTRRAIGRSFSQGEKPRLPANSSARIARQIEQLTHD